MSIDELEAEALKLSADERERLVQTLLFSLGSELKFEEQWTEEIDQRVAEIESGAVKPVPGSEVFQRVLDRLK